MNCTVHGFLQPEYWMGSLSLLQGIFPTQGSNPGLQHCRQILYQLSHKGNPRILELAAYPFSSGSSQARNWTGVSCIAGEFFINWAIREALKSPKPMLNPVSCILSYFNIRKAENSFSMNIFCPWLSLSTFSWFFQSHWQFLWFPLLGLLSSFATFPSSFILPRHSGLPCCSWNMPMHSCFYPGYSCLRQFHD